jgi:2-polyprenyl-6-methoxyphenol hydroxylase-like FAD-dependent oxidoreductase
VQVLVVGGGIAGLAASLALHRAGIEAEVVEADVAWSPVSSGMFLQSNGLAMLARLGLLDEVLQCGFGIPDDMMPVSTYAGQPIVTVRYPRLAGPDVPAILGIRRSALHAVLTSALDRRAIRARLGRRVVRVQPGMDRVRVTSDDGDESSWDVVVAADGIRSSIRATTFPDRAHPRYSGFGAWRCICPRPPDLVHKLMLIGPGARLGVMPISDAELYMFAISPEAPSAHMNQAAWPSLMRERFRDFGGPVPDLFATASTFHYTAVEEVPVERPLAWDRVVFIGDAAHATTPFMGQGGSMALEDAVVLAEELAGVPAAGAASIRDALTRFEGRRFPRVEFVQARSMDAGRAWGGDRSAYDPAALRESMQARVDRFYEVIAQPI